MGSTPAAVGTAGSSNVPWTQRAYLNLNVASDVSGLSTGSFYNAAKAGRITLLKLGGRTVVTPAELQKFLASAEAWTPSAKTQKAVEARTARTRAAWAGA